jgi:hypothetical protein
MTMPWSRAGQARDRQRTHIGKPSPIPLLPSCYRTYDMREVRQQACPASHIIASLYCMIHVSRSGLAAIRCCQDALHGHRGSLSDYTHMCVRGAVQVYDQDDLASVDDFSRASYTELTPETVVAMQSLSLNVNGMLGAWRPIATGMIACYPRCHAVCSA